MPYCYVSRSSQCTSLDIFIVAIVDQLAKPIPVASAYMHSFTCKPDKLCVCNVIVWHMYQCLQMKVFTSSVMYIHSFIFII